MTKLSIIVPCRNEAANIVPLLERFKTAFDEHGAEKSSELIIVDNNSTDETSRILKQELASGKYPFARSVFEPRPGYGAAIKRGLGVACGEVLSWTHADLQTDPSDVFRAYDKFIKTGNANTIVKGARVGRPIGQVLFSFGMAAIASAVLGRLFYEINAQPKLFHRSFWKSAKNAPDDFSLDLFLIYQAKTHHYTIKDIEVEFRTRKFGESAWAYSFSSRVKTIVRTIKYIFKLRKSLW